MLHYIGQTLVRGVAPRWWRMVSLRYVLLVHSDILS